jgi:hypothetical protein
MYVPLFYLVAGGNAYAIDDDNIPFGAPVKLDGTIDWDQAYDFDPCDEDVEFVAHMCDKLMQAKALHDEQFSEVFVK